jgi:hypothetical protein
VRPGTTLRRAERRPGPVSEWPTTRPACVGRFPQRRLISPASSVLDAASMESTIDRDTIQM